MRPLQIPFQVTPKILYRRTTCVFTGILYLPPELFAATHTLSTPLGKADTTSFGVTGQGGAENRVANELSDMSVTNISLWDESIVCEWLIATGLSTLCGTFLNEYMYLFLCCSHFSTVSLYVYMHTYYTIIHAYTLSCIHTHTEILYT